MSRAPMPDSASGERPMPSSFEDDLDFYDEGRYGKLWRRLKQEPLIPLGLGMTCFALYSASRSMKAGDKEQTNRWFRARLYAQAFTIVAVVVGSFYYKEEREKRKVFQGLLAEKKAREKRDLWLRELEARDREDREERERIKAMRQGRNVSRQEILAKLDKEDADRAAKRAAEVAAKIEAEATAKIKAEEKTSASSPFELNEMRSAIIGPAMFLWRSRNGKK